MHKFEAPGLKSDDKEDVYDGNDVDSQDLLTWSCYHDFGRCSVVK
jgi:hypothetical protein